MYYININFYIFRRYASYKYDAWKIFHGVRLTVIEMIVLVSFCNYSITVELATQAGAVVQR